MSVRLFVLCGKKFVFVVQENGRAELEKKREEAVVSTNLLGSKRNSSLLG